MSCSQHLVAIARWLLSLLGQINELQALSLKQADIAQQLVQYPDIALLVREITETESAQKPSCTGQDLG